MYILSSPLPPHIVFLKKDAKTFEALEALAVTCGEKIFLPFFLQERIGLRTFAVSFLLGVISWLRTQARD